MVCTIDNFSSKLDQNRVQKIGEEINKLKKDGYIIEFHLIQAYMGIASNKWVNKVLKEVTGSELKKIRRNSTKKLNANFIIA